MVLGAMIFVFIIFLLELASAQLRIGGSLNVFSRYGYMGISMKVLPRFDEEKWLFREPIADIFRDVTSVKRKSDVTDKEDYHMELCDDFEQLKQAYFRHFVVEKSEKPWEIFVGGWSRQHIFKVFGLDIKQNLDLRSFSFILVRLSRELKRSQISKTFYPAEASLHKSVATELDKVEIGDAISVFRFVKNFGSHYIRSYSTGNSMYQVFVFRPDVYKKIKDTLQSGSGTVNIPELSGYFTPSGARHIGSIMTASGNVTVQKWAETNLRDTQPVGPADHLRILPKFIQGLLPAPATFPTLLKLHGNKKLLKEAYSLLENEALLKLNLSSIAPIFKDVKKQEWFLELLDNHVKLWETTFLGSDIV